MIKTVREIIIQHLVLVLAIAISLALYFKLLFFGHISWDDPEMVFKNSAVKQFDVIAFFTNHYIGNYIPMTLLVHSIGWQLFENHSGGHHAINILIHLVNGLLVYKIAGKLFRNKNFSAIAVCIFLLHPLQSESVAWIGELKNTLSSAFYLGAVYQYILYAQKNHQKYYVRALLLFLAGCLSKSSVIVLPLTLLALDLLMGRKFTTKIVVEKVPLLLLSVVFGLVNLKTQSADQFINYSHAFPYHERLAYAGFALLKYLQHFLYPINLSVLYPYPQNKMLAMFFGFGVIFLIAVLSIYYIRKKAFTSLALLLLCLINLALVLQFIPFGEALYADRYMYLPVLFFTFFFLHLLSNLKIRQDIFLYISLIALPLLTFSRVSVWKSSEILYADILSKYPDSFVALNSMGVELMYNNKHQKALEYFDQAIKAAPKNYKGYYNRGLLFLKSKEPQRAIESFNQALAIFEYNKAYASRAAAYYLLKDLPKAMKDAEYVLSKDKNNLKARFVLGNCYNELNRLEEALREYNKCIEINPEEPDYYFKRAIVYGKQQKFKESQDDLSICLQFNPTYFEAYFWRGVAKLNLKQDPCEDFVIAARNNIEPAIQSFKRYCN